MKLKRLEEMEREEIIESRRARIRSPDYSSTVKNKSTPLLLKQNETDIEANVIRAILSRQNYLTKLTKVMLNGNIVSDDTLKLLGHIRTSTVDAVEAIGEWKNTQKGNPEFLWEGINYLLEIPSDLDYLGSIRPLTNDLGFSLTRNPFILPSNLDQADSKPNEKDDSTTIDGITIRRIKYCERLIKQEEEEYGIISRDRDGSLLLALPEPKKKTKTTMKKGKSLPALHDSVSERNLENESQMSEESLSPDNKNISDDIVTSV